ncbi:MAG: alpha-amylase, partial [Bacteroidales bacterium]
MKLQKLMISLTGLALLMGVQACGPSPDNDVPADVVVSSVDHPEWSINANIYEVNTRQYTQEGTFEAFEEHL